MLKHGLIYDKSYWEQFRFTAIDFADFDELIYQSVVIKKMNQLKTPLKKHT
jgi:3-dehydroquinate synthase